jgi:hypothetical protein
MKAFLKSTGIAVFSSFWVVGILGAANRCLLVGIYERTPGSQAAVRAVHLLEDARRDLVIGGVWLGLVMLYWTYRLSHHLDRWRGEPYNPPPERTGPAV